MPGSIERSRPRNEQLSYLPPRKNGKTLQKDVSKRKKMVDTFAARNQLTDWSLFIMSIEKKFVKEKKSKFILKKLIL